MVITKDKFADEKKDVENKSYLLNDRDVEKSYLPKNQEWFDNWDRRINSWSFEEREEVISKALSMFYVVGKCLQKIRDEKSYKKLGYSTFEEYCVKRWGFASSRARQLMGAAEVIEDIKSVTQGNTFPETEKQARALTGLSPENKAKVMNEALETAPNGKLTAPHIKQTRERMEKEEEYESEEEELESRDRDSRKLVGNPISLAKSANGVVTSNKVKDFVSPSHDKDYDEEEIEYEEDAVMRERMHQNEEDEELEKAQPSLPAKTPKKPKHSQEQQRMKQYAEQAYRKSPGPLTDEIERIEDEQIPWEIEPELEAHSSNGSEHIEAEEMEDEEEEAVLYLPISRPDDRQINSIAQNSNIYELNDNVIATNIRSFHLVTDALLRIKREKLYTKYAPTFEAYCEKWGINLI